MIHTLIDIYKAITHFSKFAHHTGVVKRKISAHSVTRTKPLICVTAVTRVLFISQVQTTTFERKIRVFEDISLHLHG